MFDTCLCSSPPVGDADASGVIWTFCGVSTQYLALLPDANVTELS